MTAMRNKLQRRTLCLALALCVSATAHAQSNASGTIFGNAGQAGAVVLVENTQTGQVRHISTDENGGYRASSLPVGTYKVTVQREGQTVATRENISVRLGAGSEVSFAGAGDAQNLDAIVVTGVGASPIDVSATDTRIVFTAEQLQRLPVARSIQAIALLTPGVVEADSAYPDTVSFGGSAASENAFYINGYPVTNPLTNLGSTTLPFDGISQFQAITGGYGAEFGRATGGVVNIITQTGGNEWRGGVMASWEPDSLRSNARNVYYPHNGTARDGLLQTNNRDGKEDELQYGAYVSGPLIRDRLFLYASGEYSRNDVIHYEPYPGGEGTYQDISYKIPRWMAKLDWYINDDHRLEFTGVSDVTKEDGAYSYYAYTGPNAYRRGERDSGYYYEDGGELYIGKYTGYLTDSLTLTALYGEQEQDHIAIPSNYDPSQVYITDTRNTANPVSRGFIAQLPFPDAYDKTHGGRLDVEWRIGDHSLRVGYDRHDSESRAGTLTSGPGYTWTYNNTGAGAENDPIEGAGGAVGPGGNGDYVVRTIYNNGGTFEVQQQAFYLEDRWQLSDNWLLTLGLRNEGFKNFNADGVVYIEQENQWAPRLGASWDVFGDSSFKLFANAGRYHLALPNNVARRGAAASTFTNEYFGFTSIDPVTGLPQGLTPLGNGPYSTNNEYGQAPDPASVAAKGLKSHFQDEFVVGFEKQLSEKLTMGARYVYRDLKSAIDDTCDGRPAVAWALRNGYSQAVADNLGAALQGCRLFNPGEGNTFQLNDGTGRLVTVDLSAQDMGFPKLKRRYQGLDLFLEHPFDGTWYYKVDYTWSKNYGNAEGQLKSDIGQPDVSQTQDWDHPELMEYANGNLPNDRRHYLKAFGYLQLNSEWRVSSTMIAHSGRPKNCFGYYNGASAEDPDFHAYPGPYYFYCNDQPSPRGSQGNLPWTTRWDLGVNYAPDFADNRLQIGVDVFNVLNKQTTQNIIEYGELGSPGTPYHSTNRVISYSAPRSVRMTIRYDF
ncbi:MAG TPA: TonB-dependent receptor [Pseudoxanthomonas sp.]|nr:TonB-dependent receptor [Pseudoxanthomonas sp.]